MMMMMTMMVVTTSMMNGEERQDSQGQHQVGQWPIDQLGNDGFISDYSGTDEAGANQRWHGGERRWRTGGSCPGEHLSSYFSYPADHTAQEDTLGQKWWIFEKKTIFRVHFWGFYDFRLVAWPFLDQSSWNFGSRAKIVFNSHFIL